MAATPAPSPGLADEQEAVPRSPKEGATAVCVLESLDLGPKVSLVLQGDDLVVTGM